MEAEDKEEAFYVTPKSGRESSTAHWIELGWDGNLCVGLLYEHRFAMLKKMKLQLN